MRNKKDVPRPKRMAGLTPGSLFLVLGIAVVMICVHFYPVEKSQVAKENVPTAASKSNTDGVKAGEEDDQNESAFTHKSPISQIEYLPPENEDMSESKSSSLRERREREETLTKIGMTPEEIESENAAVGFRFNDSEGARPPEEKAEENAPEANESGLNKSDEQPAMELPSQVPAAGIPSDKSESDGK